MPHTFVNAARKPHDGTVCEGVLVTETAISPPLRRLLLSDVLYINGMSLKALPYVQRAGALRKEVVDRVHERKQQDFERVQQSPFKSVGLREFWPMSQVEKVKRSLIPSLTHACKGVIVLDGKAPYGYGDQPSRCWEWNGWRVCVEETIVLLRLLRDRSDIDLTGVDQMSIRKPMMSQQTNNRT